MRVTAVIVFAALAANAGDVGAVERFRPAAPDYVVLHVPARATNDPIAVLEQQLQLAPADSAIVAQLGALYVERARAAREPRYFGRAEALLQRWVERPDAPADLLRVQADILQNRHDFSGAMRLLDRAIARAPRDAGSHLMRASISMVQGRAAAARQDCVAVMASGESTAGTVCIAQILGSTGRLAQGETLVRTLLDHEPRLAPQWRGWALGLLADFADRRGDAAGAERLLRSALAATPGNEGVRSALCDVLIARHAPGEVLTLLDLPAPSVGLLERRARAQELMHDPALSATRARIDELLSVAARRGERPHLREEALLALDVARDDERALALAKANFEMQRETIDVRLLARAARTRADRAALNEVARWIRESGFEDRSLADLRS